MVDFQSVYPVDPADEIRKKIADIEEQLSTTSPLAISGQVESTLKRMTRRMYAGTGADGDASFDGGAVGGFSLAGSTYTQTADKNFDNVVVAEGYVVVTRQYLLFIKGTLQNNGTIYANGAWW